MTITPADDPQGLVLRVLLGCVSLMKTTIHLDLAGVGLRKALAKHFVLLVAFGVTLGTASLWSADTGPVTNAACADKVPSTRDLSGIKKAVETLRAKKFRQDVPVFTVSESELRAIARREMEKEYSGRKLGDYQTLMSWMDVLPPGTDLGSVAEEFLVGGVAGLYDSDTKEMCIPAVSPGGTNALQNPANKKVEKGFAGMGENLVFAHEFTHALEDEYWPFDDPETKDRHESTDRSMAQSFLTEGSATCLMIEAIPALTEGERKGTYITVWNMLHSGLVELVLDLMLKGVWKSDDANVPGVPETLARSQTMPYAYGYGFCSDLVRRWGLDGLNYIYDHPPVSSAQLMHPEKAWEWRDLPVQIALPETLAGEWKQLTGDSLGEAGIAALLGCSFHNLNRGAMLASGWDGDVVSLYEGPDGRHLLVWASSWSSESIAKKFAETWVRQRQVVHRASISQENGCMGWASNDGRCGVVVRKGVEVLVFETDKPGALAETAFWSKEITFTQPPEDAVRAAANHLLLRANPVFSWRKDADYTVSQTLWGVLSRHDRNSVGASDRLLWGVLADSRRTASFHRWELGWSLLAKRQSDSRRGFRGTSLLPWGILYSEFSTKLPQHPEHNVSRKTVLWGLAGSHTEDSSDRVAFQLLPWGLLFRTQKSPGYTGTHVLGTGVSKTTSNTKETTRTQFRFLGIPVWSSHAATKPDPAFTRAEPRAGR
jgi:hypothetical protein